MTTRHQRGVVGCVTINLAGLGFAWFEERFDALVRGLEELEPDVVCFQEATVRKGAASYNQAEAVGQALALPSVAFAPYGNPIEATSHEVGGVAIVSRWPIGLSESWRLPEGAVEAPDNRVALLVKLLASWGDLFVTTTHLSWRPEAEAVRARQLAVILEHLGDLGLCHERAPLLLAGDLNALESETAVAHAQRLLRDCFRARHPGSPGFTWSRANPLASGFCAPDRRLDYVFCPAEAYVREACVVLDRPDPVYPSDHFGLFVAVEFGCLPPPDLRRNTGE